MFWCLVDGLMLTNIIHSSLSLYNTLSKTFAIEVLLKNFLRKRKDTVMTYYIHRINLREHVEGLVETSNIQKLLDRSAQSNSHADVGFFA